jgi:hypothetical protein
MKPFREVTSIQDIADESFRVGFVSGVVATLAVIVGVGVIVAANAEPIRWTRPVHQQTKQEPTDAH